MSWDAAFAAERDAAARGPLAANPATLGEVWDASWNAAGLDTVFGVGKPWAQAHDELRQQIETVSGQSLSDLAEAQGKRLQLQGYAGATLQQQARELADLAAGLTPEQQEKVKPYLDIPARARTIAAETERRAADISDRTYGLSGHALGFLAGTARQALDPVNLGTMFVGGPARSALLPMLAREFGLGAAAQAIQEPAIEAGRADLGLEAGLGRALTNTLEAGIGNAGLAGLFRGAGWLMRRGVDLRDGAAARPAAESGAAPESLRLDAASAEAQLSDGTVEAEHAVSPQDVLDDRRPAGEIRAELVRRGWLRAIPERLDPRMEEVERLRQQVYDISAGIEGSRGVYPKSEQQIRELTARADQLERVIMSEALLPRPVSKAPAVLPAALRELAPEDLDAAARLAERDRLVDDLSPDPSSAGKAVHADALEEMTARMEASRAEIMAGFDRKLQELETRLRGSGDAQGETAGGPAVSPPAATPARRRQRPAKPVTLARFVASLGGIRLDADAVHAGFDKVFVPGHGPLARRSGLAIDQLEPTLIAEGYLPPQPADAPSRDITRELYAALDNEIRHKQPTYAQRDHTAVIDRQAAEADAAMDARWRDEIAAEAAGIRTRMAEAGLDPAHHPEDIEAAAELIVRGAESDWGDALERVAVSREMADDAAVPAAREMGEDAPDWHLLDERWEPDDALSGREAPDGRGAAGSGGEDAARPADRRGSAPAGEDVPQPGEAGAAAGGREGDASLAASLGRLAAATDDPAAFKARLADLDRAMAANGGDLTVHLDGGDVSLRARLEEIRADADAAEALKACLGQGGGEGGA